MRVLLTGHCGYIGTILVPMLHQAGHQVRGLDSDLFARCTFGEPAARIDSLTKDVRDVAASDLLGCEAVIHLAGLSNDPLGDYRPELTEAINHAATLRLAKLARDAGVQRFLFASSCSVYGAAGSDWVNETAAMRPVTPYGACKARAEEALSRLASGHFSPTYLRASTAYGASPRLRFDLVLNNLAAWAFTTGQVHLKSDGTPWRPLVHVQDIASAYLAVLEAPRQVVHDTAFNVGTTTENYQIGELAEIVQEIVPDCRIQRAADAGPDQRCYRVDCNRIARELAGFKPQWTVRRGVEQLHAVYRRHGLTLAEFEGPQYKRIDHIKQLIAQGLLAPDLRWAGRRQLTGSLRS
jgi:nucleoside-diphosphate-sugar epimerase